MTRSPFFTQSKYLNSLYDYLKPYYPEFDSEKLEKKRVFHRVFDTPDYSDVKMRNLMKEMCRLVEMLLIYNKLEASPERKKHLLLEVFSDRGEKKLYWGLSRELERRQQELPYRDREYYQNKHERLHLDLQMMASQDLSARIAGLQQAAAALTGYYQLSAIHLEAEMQVLSEIVSIPDRAEDSGEEGVLYHLYSEILELYKRKEVERVGRIKQLLLDQQECIRKPQQLDLLLFLINFAVGQMKVNDSVYNAVVLELYQDGLKNNIIAWNEKLTANTFVNIAVTGAKAGEFEWVAAFIKTYNHMLPAERRADIVVLSQAYVHFHQHHFQHVIRLLNQHDFSDGMLHLSARVHSLRSYYELYLQDDTYHEFLIDQTFAFEKYIRRNTLLSEMKQQAYLNFVQFIRLLANERSRGKLTEAEQEKFQQKLDDMKVTISRSWLLEKIAQ
jgi:hypothetical protein